MTTAQTASGTTGVHASHFQIPRDDLAEASEQIAATPAGTTKMTRFVAKFMFTPIDRNWTALPASVPTYTIYALSLSATGTLVHVLGG